ncbi:LysR family transcriptional regulator [Leifsonia sp. Root227]|nr:LysR family transcriptional regulator [Leifsonia sp. Root227]
MELKQLRTFEVVAREGTVGAAAIALNRAPSSVSEQVRSLEESLGVMLFERGSRGMRLTAPGERLLGWARTLLDHADAARRDVTSSPIEVHLAALETLMAIHVPQMLRRLADRRPGVVTQTSSRTSRAELLSDVTSGRVDAGLLLDLGDRIGDLGFEPPQDDLTHLDLESVALSVVVAPSHALASAQVSSSAHLDGHPFIGNNPNCSFWLACNRIARPGAQRIEAGSLAIAKAWTAQGMGVALLPDFAIEHELAAGALVRLQVPAPDLSLRLIWRPDREVKPGVRDLLYAAVGRSGPPR